MRLTNKAISTKFLNIIIRTSHGQREIVMQYGSFRSSVTCVTTSCSNNSFASPTHLEPINRWIKVYGMLFHSCTSASCSPCSVSVDFDGGEHVYRVHPIMFNGDRYGDNAGRGRTRMWFWFRKSWQTRATWHLALSCWKTWSKFRCCRKGRTIGSRIWSLYFTVFNVPWTILSWVRPSWQIPAQTIILSSPKRSDSYTHWSVKRFQRLRYTR